MKKEPKSNLLISMQSLAIVFVMFFAMAFACVDDKGEDQTTHGGGAPNIQGTAWKMSSVHNKGYKPKEGGGRVVATLLFCKSGNWDMVRYGLTPGSPGAVGMRGTYTVSGNSVTLKNDTDGLSETYKMTWKPNENTLELEGGKTIMVLTEGTETACK